MQKLLRLPLALLAILLLSISAAFADHMTGSYVGTGDAVGTNLTLEQHGVDLTGTLSGNDLGTLEGRTDGGDNVAGMVDLTGVGRYQFEGQYGEEGFTFTLVGPNGRVSFLFARAEGQAQGETPPPSDKYYYLDNGNQVGPVTQTEILTAIEAGTVARDTLVWVPGQAEWMPAETYPALAEALPPAVPEAIEYYVAENGEQVGPLTVDEVLAKIEAGSIGETDLGWTKGMDEWAALSSFAEFADAFITPPPPPEQTEEEEGPPALPGEATEEEVPPPVTPEEEPGPPELPADEAADDATTGDEEATGAGEEATADDAADPLQEAMQAMVEDAFDSRSESERAAILQCSMDAFAPLSGADRELAASYVRAGDTSPLRDRWPEIYDKVADCDG